MKIDQANIQKLMGVGFILLGVLGLAMQMHGEALRADTVAVRRAVEGR